MTSLTNPQVIAVGSLNPAKIMAVQEVVSRVWPAARLEGIDVPSGVGAMPMTNEETLLGARNRALGAQQALSADMGVGLEGGVSQEATGLLLMAWVAIVDRHGRVGIGNTARIPLPLVIAERVRAGAELGPLMDQVLHTDNIAQKEGAMGALTAGLVPRGAALAMAVAFALAPFVAPQFYGPGGKEHL